MKCLSLKQPYADLLANGLKVIEIRKWNTSFRGDFLIHASKTINENACIHLGIDRDSLVIGAIIGKGCLYDVITYTSDQEFLKDSKKHFSIETRPLESRKKRYGFLVKDAVRFEKTIPYKGKLGFFEASVF